MSDEPQVVRGIDWRSTFPFILIFRSFRVAIHPSKILLALIALLLIYIGGCVLDSLWKISPKYRAVPNELALFEESRTQANPRDWFNRHRNDRLADIGAAHKRLLATDVPKKDATLSDLEYVIKQDRDRDAKAVNDAYDKSKKDFDAEQMRNRALREVYYTASNRWREAHRVQGVGLFHSYADYQMSQLNQLARSARTGNLLGIGGATDALVGFFAWGPLWAMGHHYVFFTIFGLYFLFIWSIFGGAISRIAAVHIARDEKISIRQALAFSLNKFLSFMSAPIIPLVIVGVVGLVVALGGAIGMIPGIGPIVVGGLFFLALAAGFIMTLVLLGTVGGINLMYPTIAVEGSDSFDAISRSFSYLYARPWRLAFYTLIALIYGSICYLFVRFFIYVLLGLTHFFAGLLNWSTANNSAPLFNTMWPDPVGSGRLLYDVDFMTLNSMESIGAWLLAMWVYLTIAMLGAFAISFYFSSNTVIYYLMRNEVDATELDDVYLEQSDEDFSEAPATTTVETTTVTTVETTPGASAAESNEAPPQSDAPST